MRRLRGVNHTTSIVLELLETTPCVYIVPTIISPVMIRDARVLREDFIPQEVEHRDPQVNYLSEILAPPRDGEPADPAILTGPSGAGKTCIARFTTRRLRQTVLDIDRQYVNCWQNYTRFRALHTILEGLGKTIDIHRQSTPHDELLRRLEAYDGPHCVLILDEVDQLEDKRILYDLHTLPQFSLILITNHEEELFADADDRLTSRLTGSERVHFDRYTVDELTAILDARAQWGLDNGVISTTQLTRIADTAAGDARVALNILRGAARKAQHRNSDTITDAIITDAVPEAKTEVHEKNVESLRPDQRVLYDIITEHGEIKPPQLYEEYQSQVEDPKTNRTVRNHLQKMAHYDLIDAVGTSRDRVYKATNSANATAGHTSAPDSQK